jgi:hypothetical protein
MVFRGFLVSLLMKVMASQPMKDSTMKKRASRTVEGCCPGVNRGV